MKATIVDLRYKMNDVLKALGRNEQVTVLYRGKVKGILIPSGQKSKLKITDHPFFGMSPRIDEKTVQDLMDDLRGSRYDDV
ncbi:toxin-antitoxin system, antitoxin component, PHD family [delta proteobacterium NaphS2]|nr:toxin-antitoxin system, antitoxin component, PHD family [delta proteobacterium NaphS2]